MMTFFRNRLVFLSSLLLYTLLLTATLLYFRFPTEKLKIACQAKLEQLLPATRCSITRLSYSFPLTLTAEKIKFSSREAEGRELFTIHQANVSPKLLSPKSHFHVILNGYGGENSFTLLLNRTQHEFTLKDIHLKDLDLARIPFLGQATKREITGTLTGKGTYHGMWKEEKYMAEGQGRIMVDKGTFSLLFPIFSLKKIDLQNLEVDLVLQERGLEFRKGTFRGQELTGNFSGVLGLQSTLKSSTLSFQGELEPLPPLLKKSKYAKNMVIQLKKRHKRSALPFLLQGTVQKPSFRFDS